MNEQQEPENLALAQLDQVLTRLDTVGRGLRSELSGIKVRLSAIETAVNVLNETDSESIRKRGIRGPPTNGWPMACLVRSRASRTRPAS
jgi:hypothetical protein